MNAPLPELIETAAAGPPAAGDAAVIRFVDQVLEQAVSEKASDIHFEPEQNRFRVRCRLDGELRETVSVPAALAAPVTARVKVLSGLDAAVRHAPQDGRLRAAIAGRDIDFRVSTLPCEFGESVVLRVLDLAAAPFRLDGLGMPEKVLAGVRAAAARSRGILIATGPTGCGKTTTLHCALREVNRPGQKILTAEDPVEYEIPGAMQLAVHPAIGLTFAAALRAFLRQDPDKILAGEIRDLETARMAVQASLTGHLVMTTLHTNDSPGAITRLLDLGVEPYLVAASLETILAQRLARRLCLRCREPRRPSPELLARFEPAASDPDSKTFFTAQGCAACRGTGFRGRLGIFELLEMTDDLRALTSSRPSPRELRECAREQGMTPLRQAGYRAARKGLTTLREILHATS